MPDSGSGAVEFVFRVEDEQYFKRLHQFGVRFEVALVEVVEHVEEVLHITGVLMGFVVFAANSVAVRIGCDCGDTSQQAVDLLIADMLVLVHTLTHQRWVLLWVEG